MADAPVGFEISSTSVSSSPVLCAGCGWCAVPQSPAPAPACVCDVDAWCDTVDRLPKLESSLVGLGVTSDDNLFFTSPAIAFPDSKSGLGRFRDEPVEAKPEPALELAPTPGAPYP